ncbi:hypothetical protein CSKR_107273 [Clonorchis sinensis]|uniref:Uncharacterized protein n=1 Tax=Clonorchis sinensis TaxID=79923 RepID=A0A3R7CIC8_CLOSI|nr:hypothetical protein CSKR_107273 [Clonorchis sinensis]
MTVAGARKRTRAFRRLSEAQLIVTALCLWSLSDACQFTEKDQEIRFLESRYYYKVIIYTFSTNLNRFSSADTISTASDHQKQCPTKIRKSNKIVHSNNWDSVYWVKGNKYGDWLSHIVGNGIAFLASCLLHRHPNYSVIPGSIILLTLKFRVGLQQYAKRNLLTRQLPVVSLYAMSSKIHLPPAES